MFDFLFYFLPLRWQPLARQGAALLLIVAGTLVAYWLLRRALRLARERGRMPEPVEIVSLFFVRYTLLITALLMILQRLGVLGNFWGILSAVLAMVAIGFFAVWSVLSNLMCTLYLLVARPFRAGDTVELCPEGLKGKVIDLSFTYTTLREDGGELLRVPNNLFLQKILRVKRGEQRLDLADQLVKESPTE
ncbi:MAG: mechanosensitive ion channel domain-containing protein [bacterium]